MSYACLFPGQASQAVGMGRELAESYNVAAQVFEEVNTALNQNLSGLMFNGPFKELTRPENALPALLAVGVAVIEVLKAEKIFDVSKDAAYLAGNSAGGYSALCVAGSLSLSQAATFLRRRGLILQAAAPENLGGMLRLIGCDRALGERIALQAAQKEVCVIANDGPTDKIVLSGHTAAIDRAMKIAADCNVPGIEKLAVAAPFHCSLMQSAEEPLRQALSEVDIRQPKIPVVSDVTARLFKEPSEIRECLIKQLTQPVRWRDAFFYMRNNGVTKMIECGPGGILTSSLFGIEGLYAQSVSTPEEIRSFAAFKTEELKL